MADPDFPDGEGRQQKPIITVRKRSCGKIMFSQVCVKNSVHKGRGIHPPSRHTSPLGRHTPQADIPRANTPRIDTLRQTPLSRHSPSQADTPSPGQTSPWTDEGRRLLQQMVRILLECILVWQDFCRNLHENERNWTGGVPSAPLDPSMLLVCSASWVLNRNQPPVNCHILSSFERFHPSNKEHGNGCDVGLLFVHQMEFDKTRYTGDANRFYQKFHFAHGRHSPGLGPIQQNSVAR